MSGLLFSENVLVSVSGVILALLTLFPALFFVDVPSDADTAGELLRI